MPARSLSCAPPLSPWNSPTASWRKPASCPQLLHRLVGLAVAQVRNGVGCGRHGGPQDLLGCCSRDGGSSCVLSGAEAAPVAAEQKPLLLLYLPTSVALCAFLFVEILFPHHTPVPMERERCSASRLGSPGASKGPRRDRALIAAFLPPLCLWPAPLPAEAVLDQAKVRDKAEPEVQECPFSLDVPLIFQCFGSPPDGSQDPSLIPGFPFGSC